MPYITHPFDTVTYNQPHGSVKGGLGEGGVVVQYWLSGLDHQPSFQTLDWQICCRITTRRASMRGMKCENNKESLKDLTKRSVICFVMLLRQWPKILI